MARIGVVCLILVELLLIQAIARNDEISDLKSSEVEVQKWVVSRIAEEPVSNDGSEVEGSIVAEAPAIRRMGKHNSEWSVAGGGLIIGGFVTVILAAVFCYIRVTRKYQEAH